MMMILMMMILSGQLKADHIFLRNRTTLREAGDDDKLLLTHELHNTAISHDYLGHRAIGVVYNPVYEKYGNYVPSIIPQRYDAFIYLDKTEALKQFHLDKDSHKTPETYPFGV